MAATAKKVGPPVFMHAPRDGLSFGVLRREFSGVNDVVSFAHKKLHPNTATAASPQDLKWSPNCSRHDLILTREMPDVMAHYPVILHSFECEADAQLKSLMLHIKARLDEGQALDSLWGRASSFAARFLRDEHGLATILALHDPPAGTGSTNPPHVHLMTFARRFDGRRWSDVTELACDDGHEILAAAWKATA